MQVKAAIMTSARKPTHWKQAADKPLDDILGAGIIDGERAKSVNFGTLIEHSGGMLCATLVWNRHIHTPNGWGAPEYTFHPLTLSLWSEDGLHAKSESVIDNIQHIYINLPAGSYELEVEGEEEDYAVAWI